MSFNNRGTYDTKNAVFEEVDYLEHVMVMMMKDLKAHTELFVSYGHTYKIYA